MAMHKDSDGLYVRYAADVPADERISGLTAYLEEEYDKIVSFVSVLFGKTIKTPLRLPVVLCTECPVRTYTNTDENDAERKTLGLQNVIPRDMNMPMYGNYYHTGAPFELPEIFSFADGGKPYVELYYKNIEATDEAAYRAKLSQSFAHEFFHVVHEAYTPCTFVENPRTIVGSRVKEAISDFFSVLYLCYSHTPSDKKAAVASGRYAMWHENLGSAWHYAHAAWFTYIGGRFLPFEPNYEYFVASGCVEKYKKVFFVSRDGLAVADKALKQ